MTEMDRRQFLGLVGAAAVVGCHGGTPADPVADPVDPPDPRAPEPGQPWAGLGEPDRVVFDMGVQAGDPTVDGALLWTRYAGAAPLSVTVVSWDGAAWAEEVTLPASPADGGYVHVVVSGLTPDAVVSYQFQDEAGARSIVGTFRTAPEAAHTGTIRLGVGSCFHQSHDAFPSLEAVVAAGPLDAFVFLGDTAYFDDVASRQGFRDLWKRNLTAPGFDALLPAAASIYTWDDHEVANNYDAETLDPARMELGTQAFLEAVPLRPDAAHPTRMWRSLRLGKAAEIFVLDSRSERRRSLGRYLSPEQEAWLVAGVSASDATWKVIVNSVPIMRFDHVTWGIGRNDRWEGYPEARAALIEALEGIPGVLFLSGDVHCPVIGRVEAEGPGSGMWDLVVGPGGSFLNVLADYLVGTPNVVWTAVAWNAAQVDLHADGTLEVVFLGEDGAALASATLRDDGTVVKLDVPGA